MKLRQRYIFTKTGHLRLRFVCLTIFAVSSFLSLFTHLGTLGTSAEAHIVSVQPETIDKIEDVARLIEQSPETQENLPQIASAAGMIPAALPAPKPARRMFTVQSGDSLSGILEKASLSRAESYDIVQALQDEFNPRDMKVGQKILVDVEKNDDGQIFKGLYIQKNPLDYIKLARLDAGNYDVQSLTREFKMQPGFAQAEINESAPSLYVALRRQGVPVDVIADMIRYYSWDIDFQRDIHQGNTIEVYYEKAVLDDGETISGKSRLIYAQLGNIYGSYPMFRFEKENGRIDYFNDKGESVRKALLSTPVDGARLSSGYGMRKHPVSGYHKMHKGVDFAAPTGTPVYAAGDGVIERADWFSSFGNYVRIRHNGDLKTAYAHLHKFGPGIKAGVKVKQGQVIGYIGSTGRSTGPHLHYEVHKGDTQVNPNSLKLPNGEKLNGPNLERFKTERANILRQIKSLSRENERIAMLKNIAEQ